jgi:antitoxin ParD1/3/4
MEQTEEDRLAFLRNAWVAGRESGDAGPAEFASIKAQGRALLRRQEGSWGVAPHGH